MLQEKCFDEISMFILNSRILFNSVKDEVVNLVVVNFSVNRSNVGVALGGSERHDSRVVPFSVNVAVKRSARISVTGALFWWVH
jgi:hypothetical protein